MISICLMMYGAILCLALFATLCQFLVLSCGAQRMISIGEILGFLSIFLAIEAILCSYILSNGTQWVFGIQIPMIFAGLSGFFRSRRFPAITLMLITLFLLYNMVTPNFFGPGEGPPPPPEYGPSLPPPEIPQSEFEPLPPPPPPMPLSLGERIFERISSAVLFLVFGVWMVHPILAYGVPYAIAIAGFVSSITRNRQEHSTPWDG